MKDGLQGYICRPGLSPSPAIPFTDSPDSLTYPERGIALAFRPTTSRLSGGTLFYTFRLPNASPGTRSAPRYSSRISRASREPRNTTPCSHQASRLQYVPCPAWRGLLNEASPLANITHVSFGSLNGRNIPRLPIVGNLIY